VSVCTGGRRRQGSGGLDQERRDDLQALDGLLVFSSFATGFLEKEKRKREKGLGGF
jgi:hypothetical protein